MYIQGSALGRPFQSWSSEFNVVVAALQLGVIGLNWPLTRNRDHAKEGFLPGLTVRHGSRMRGIGIHQYQRGTGNLRHQVSRGGIAPPSDGRIALPPQPPGSARRFRNGE